MALKKVLVTVLATVALGATPVAAAARPAEAAAVPSGTLAEAGGTLADLRFTDGLRAVFSHDTDSGEYGLVQDGRVDRNAPLARPGAGGLLATFLDLTPATVAVPEALLRETSRAQLGSRHRAALATRGVSRVPVVVSGLRSPARTTTARYTCADTYYPWMDWHDGPAVGLAPKTYYSADFDGRTRYAETYVINCTPKSSPGYLWARHRIYYRTAFGAWKQHFEGKVAPGSWQAAIRGSVKRYRAVSYDDGWNSSPNCATCRYTREGRFDS